jgi:septum formation protein
MQQQQILLASASPRRAQLLNQIGVCFHVQAQDIDETIRQGELPAHYVMRMAEEKAESALSRLGTDQQSTLVLAADTSVVCDAEVLGKPESQSDAVTMLQLLSGREHLVLSAVTLAGVEKQESLLSESKVRFRKITEAEAERYYLSGEPIGKAGSYAIQGYGAVFVEQLIGSYSGVMGLPLFETAQLLSEFGIHGQQQNIQA